MTQVQLCLVHMVRNSLSYVGWKERKAVAADLRLIYRGATEGEAEQALGVFEEKWGRKYPSIGKSWRGHWGGTDDVFEISSGDTKGNIYDQRDRVRESVVAQDQQESWGISERRIAA